jgi:hypothetical protein
MPDIEQKLQWELANKLTIAAIPLERKQEVDEIIKEHDKVVYRAAGLDTAGRMIGWTFTLVVGWIVHIALT